MFYMTLTLLVITYKERSGKEQHEGDSRSAIWPGRSWQHFPTREAAAISACQMTGVDRWRSDLQDTSITYAMLNSVPLIASRAPAKSGSNTLLMIIGRGSTIVDAT